LPLEVFTQETVAGFTQLKLNFILKNNCFLSHPLRT